jgi:hypothetical protein
MGFYDRLFGKINTNDIESKIENFSNKPSENENREISFSMKYWIDWKPETKEKDWSKTSCCYEEEGGERYKLLCKRLYDLDRLYTRAEIESISLKLGYSVFDSPGGSDDCCCYWNSKVIPTIKK